jgi:hypothetical protein
MKDNTRRVPGSTRSCRIPLSQSGIPPRRLRNESKKSVQNPYKSDHFRRYEFFNCSASGTYNSDTLKCTDFRNTISSLLFDDQGLPSESHDIGFDGRFACSPLSLGERVRVRDKPVHSSASPPRGARFSHTVQNGTKWDDLTFLRKWTTLYQQLTTTLPAFVPFFTEWKKKP